MRPLCDTARVCARFEPVVSNTCSTSAAVSQRGRMAIPGKVTGRELGVGMEMGIGWSVTDSYSKQSQPVPLNGFARLLIASQPTQQTYDLSAPDTSFPPVLL